MKPPISIAPLVLMITVLSSGPVHASGRGAGNGGDAVVCRDAKGQISSAELLDYYEGRTIRDLIANAPADRADPLENAEKLIARLDSLDPRRAGLYRMWLKSFGDEAKFIKNQTLIDIPDSHHLSFPQGCQVEQLIIQQNPRFKEDPRYLINEDIYKALPPLSQSGAILHELFLRETVLFCAPNPDHDDCNSIVARYLNVLLASDKAARMTRAEWSQVAQQLKTQFIFSANAAIENRQTVLSYGVYNVRDRYAFSVERSFPAFGTTKILISAERYEIDSAGQKRDGTVHFEVGATSELKLPSSRLTLEPGDWISADGLLISLKAPREIISRGARYKVAERLTFQGQSGALKAIALSEKITLTIGAQKIELPENGSVVQFFEDGAVEAFSTWPDRVILPICSSTTRMDVSVATYDRAGRQTMVQVPPLSDAPFEMTIQGKLLWLKSQIICREDVPSPIYQIYSWGEQPVLKFKTEGNRTRMFKRGDLFYLDAQGRMIEAPTLEPRKK
jgi:hypothetical protein